MKLAAIDWLIIAAYFALSLSVGLYFTRRASRSTDEYFLAGRSLPWWLAGVSIVATTFSSDTPLLVTGITARGGIAGNWVWWAFVLSGMMTVFFFAKLWRRANVMTDVEFASIRYSGRAADFLRIFRAVYLGLPINALVAGSVTLAMVKILRAMLDINEWTAVLICFAITGLYSTLGGFLGVMWTDFFQFFLAMIGSIGLAYFAVDKVGGLSAIPAGLAGTGRSPESFLAFLADPHSTYLPFVTLCVFFAVQWWAAWYPGAEPGGGGYVAQRMFASKDEKSSLLAVLSFNVLHYTVRPWPWILTALASMIYYAGDAAVKADPESGYVRMIADALPTGWRGILVAAMLAAYMSTISTQLNWGASYLVNDVYRPYLRKGASERHYVMASRAASILIMVLSGAVSLVLGRVTNALDYLLAIGAGTGLVLILRWYWWRVNAWSEISAMIAATVVSLTLQLGIGPAGFGLDPKSSYDSQAFGTYSLLITTAIVTIVWLAVTYLTKPTDEATLVAFYRRTRPSRLGWGPIVRLVPEVRPSEGGGVKWMQWAFGCALVYLSLFGVGNLVFGNYLRGIVFIMLSLLAGAVILAGLSRTRDEDLWHRDKVAPSADQAAD
jgi:SSS family transporter